MGPVVNNYKVFEKKSHNEQNCEKKDTKSKKLHTFMVINFIDAKKKNWILQKKETFLRQFQTV